MATPKITTFIIALLTIGVISSFIGFFMSDLAVNYTTPDDYSSEDIQLFNKLNTLTNQINETKDSLEGFRSNNPLDFLGATFNAGYSSLETVGSSFNTFYTLMNHGLHKLPIAGPMLQVLQSYAAAVVMVLIVVGIFIAVIVKRDL